MTILSGEAIRTLFVYEGKQFPTKPGDWVPPGSSHIVEPMVDKNQHRPTGTSYGLSHCGYDIRLDQNVILRAGRTVLASTLEEFMMPNDVVGVVHDKSTWARRGISVQNTVIEPGWRGFLTLEILYSPLWDGDDHVMDDTFYMIAGTPIAQVIFHELDAPAVGYSGKYQDQKRGPQEAL